MKTKAQFKSYAPIMNPLTKEGENIIGYYDGHEKALDKRHTDGEKEYVKFIAIRKEDGTVNVFSVNRSIKQSFTPFGEPMVDFNVCIANYEIFTAQDDEMRLVKIVCRESEVRNEEDDSIEHARCEIEFPVDIVDMYMKSKKDE